MLRNKVILIILITLLLSCEAKEYKYSKTVYVMGTTLELILFVKDSKKVEKLIEEAVFLAKDLEKKSSCKIEDSLLSVLNTKKELIIEDNFLLDLLKQSYYFAFITEGNFDPSLYNLLKLWGFENENNRVPAREEIQKALSQCGYENIIIKGKRVILKNNISLDLGGIAKGKIVDEVSLFLKKNNINNFIVNAGGDLFVSGLFNSERKWKVAIASPFNKNDIIGIIEVSELAVVTSGDYERFFVFNGKNYHHILDPFTGYPVNNGLHSVTVISKDATNGDALATAFFVMGKEKTLKFVNSSKDLAVILIGGSNENPEICFSNNISASKELNNKWKFELR